MKIQYEDKRKIEANIERLDYLKGTGVLSTNKKHLAKEVFVFIGVGGTGVNSLIRLKKTVINQVEHTDVEKRVMFLAVDTDHVFLRERIESGELEEGEVLRIPFEGAHDSISPSSISPELKKWVHKDLWEDTGSTNRVSNEFSGTGAGAKRQCGRVLFSQQTVQHMLKNHLTKIQGLVSNLTQTPKVKVFFLTGISGGTGSGCILDLTFLTRYFLKTNILPALYNKGNVVFSGYIFLPNASGAETSDNQMTGNRNAYAALKEIDYYMTITNRRESFVMNYGTPDARHVVIGDDLFNFCTLVEGVSNGGGRFLHPRETHQIVADSILNIICADNANTYSTDNNVFLVDSFLSNSGEKSEDKIKMHDDRIWPRNTNYIYNVIGISSCIVPVDLLTVYVAKKIFDKVFANFNNHKMVDVSAAQEFLTECGLDIRTLRRKQNITKEQIEKDIQAHADARFKAYGPYYMVNLTKEAVNLIENAPNDYLHKVREKQNGLFIVNIEIWRALENVYNLAVEYLTRLNQDLYEIYSYAIEVLQDLIEKNAKLLTDTQEYKSQFGSTFCWSPIDLTPGTQATLAVTKYLDGMLSAQEIEEKAGRFVEDLCEKRDEWTQLSAPEGQGIAKFDVANVIREFISENLKQCTESTLEEFLVKAYSGKVEANVKELDAGTGREICSEETKKAAQELMISLSSKAHVLASTNGFNLNECYSNIYLTIPQNCRYLKEAILKIAAIYQLNENMIYESSAQDRVVFCNLYAGVPAWALFWTSSAEESYESNGPYSVALHLNQGENGTNGADLPNLYPEKLWTQQDMEVRVREKNISDKIRADMEAAKELSMLAKKAETSPYYTVVLLEKPTDAEELLIKADLKRGQRYGLREVLDILVKKGELASFEINFTGMVMTTPEVKTQQETDAFEFDLACRTMRLFQDKAALLTKTICEIRRLRQLVEERPDDSLITDFIMGLRWGLLEYDKNRNIWYNETGDEIPIGSALNDKFEQLCAHYYGFLAFAKMDEDARESMKEKISELEEQASAAQFESGQRKMKELKVSLESLRTAKKQNVKPWPDGSPFESANETAWPMASDRFTDRAGNEVKAKTIRDFYTDLIDNI